MSIHEDMKSLTQEISSSYEARGATIASIAKAASAQRQAAQKQLRESSAARHATGRQLQAELRRERKDLAHQETQRSSQVQTWVKDMAQDHAGAREEWQRLTVGMRAKRVGGAAVAEVPTPAIIEEQAPRKKSQKKAA